MKWHLLPSAAILLLLFTGLAGCSQSAASATEQSAAPAAAAGQAPAMGQAKGLITGDTAKLVADYERQCAGQRPRSRDCEILRSLVVVEVVLGLELTERSLDQRGTAEALSALDFPEEPEIFIAACRILARFPNTPGIAAKVLPQVFESRYLEVQKVGATLLTGLPDAGVADVGRQWLNNHGGLDTETVYDEYPEFPSHYATMEIPKYPGAEWFSPADSDRSIGWSTKDAVAVVAQWFSQTLHAEAMDANKWQEQQSLDLKQTYDQSKMTKMQDLMQKAMKGDQAATAELQKMQDEMKDAGEMAEKGLLSITPPSAAGAEARWIVAKKKDGRVSTVVLVYPMPGVQRTGIQFAWHLADYPAAWTK